MRAIVCLAVILTVSAAKDANVYVYNGFEYYGKVQSAAKGEPSDLFKFGYHLNDTLYMQIYFKNKPLNVTTDLYLKYSSGGAAMRKVLLEANSEGRENYLIKRTLRCSKIFMEVEINTATGLCTRKNIVKGKYVAKSPEEGNDFHYNNICLQSEYCVVVVDLFNNVCGESTGLPKQPSSESNSLVKGPNKWVLTYVVPSVAVVCVLVLLIYVTIKRYRRRPNTHPSGTMELNIYSTANQVIYADLNLVQGDSQPPRRDEESPYAKIIGVLRPTH